ncbi:MAG: energy-coupling factor ABC transporter permease [Lachnoclostridium sp.]
MFTYCVTSVQLALAYPSEPGGVAASAVKFLGVFAPTQLPLAVIEGILTSCHHYDGIGILCETGA